MAAEEESLYEISTFSSRSSVAVAEPAAAGLVSDGLMPRSISAGQVISGGVVSEVTVTVPLKTSISTATPAGSTTLTFDSWIAEAPSVEPAVKVIVANVSEVEVLQAAPRTVPAKPVIVPALLFMDGGQKKVPQPLVPSNGPCVVLTACISEALKLRSNCAPAIGSAGSI